MDKLNIGIAGIGMVGGACKYGFEKLGHNVSFHDPKFDTKIEDILDADIIYICVPTPSNSDGSCNTDIVEQVLDEIVYYHYKTEYDGPYNTDPRKKRKYIAIKSTTEPGFTEKMQDKYKDFNVTIGFVPEFLRERLHISDFMENHDLLAVGSWSSDFYNLVVKCHGRYPKQVAQMTATEAELLKYYSNIFNALRVTFANEMYEVCEALGADYTAIKEAFMKRGTAADIYMDVNENFRGYGGMCFVPGTKIYTSEGLIPIEDIKIGHKVLTHTGKYMPVLETFFRDIDEKILKINTQGISEPVFVTKDHLILAKKNNRKLYNTNGRQKLSSVRNKEIELNWEKADSLSKGDYVVFPVPLNNGSSEISDDQARLLGYYLAEGHIDQSFFINKYGNEKIKSSRVGFSFHANEELFHEDVCNLIINCFNGNPKKLIKNNKCVIRASGKELCDFFIQYGGRYSYGKSLPWDVIINSKDSILENILMGYFRGDGSRSCNRYTCATISINLFEQIKFILLRLKIPFTTKINKEHTGKDGTSHREAYYITVSSNIYMKRFSSILKDDFITIEKKTKTPLKIYDNKILYPIKQIGEIHYDGPVYNLEVDQDDSYVTYALTAHNCLPKDTKAMAALVKKLDLDLDLFKVIDSENNKFKKTVFDGMRME